MLNWTQFRATFFIDKKIFDSLVTCSCLLATRSHRYPTRPVFFVNNSLSRDENSSKEKSNVFETLPVIVKNKKF